jgi:hypothetical protein
MSRRSTARVSRAVSARTRTSAVCFVYALDDQSGKRKRNQTVITEILHGQAIFKVKSNAYKQRKNYLRQRP